MEANSAYHILVIRLSAMGDVAMTIPLLAALTKRYPHLRISVLTRKAFFPMFEGLDNIGVLEAKVKTQHKGLRGLWRLYRQLRIN